MILQRQRVGGVYGFADLDCLTYHDVRLGNWRDVDLLANEDVRRSDDDPVELENTEMTFKIRLRQKLSFRQFPVLWLAKFWEL